MGQGEGGFWQKAGPSLPLSIINYQYTNKVTRASDSLTGKCKHLARNGCMGMTLPGVRTNPSFVLQASMGSCFCWRWA